MYVLFISKYKYDFFCFLRLQNTKCVMRSSGLTKVENLISVLFLMVLFYNKASFIIT